MGYKTLGKRIADAAFAGMAMVPLLPLFAVLAVGIKAQDGGPVFFWHQRVGKGGKPIQVLKFRTMRQGAHAPQNALSAEQYRQYTKEYKLADDPRVTRLGKTLRKTHLDELPQLFNVVTGSMSLVGPRPITREELCYYSKEQQRRLLEVCPGLTGYWQTGSKRRATYQNGKRQRMEMYYVANASPGLDLLIVCKTILAALDKAKQ